jgi:hypothetical protein
MHLDPVESVAFVIYGSLGQPLVYVIPCERGELTEEEMTALMELFKGFENAECFLEWREVV